MLAQHKRALFSPVSIFRFGPALQPTQEQDDEDFPVPPPLGWLDPTDLADDLLLNASVWEGGRIKPLMVRVPSFRLATLLTVVKTSKAIRQPDLQEAAYECLAVLGEDIGSQVVLVLA